MTNVDARQCVLIDREIARLHWGWQDRPEPGVRIRRPIGSGRTTRGFMGWTGNIVTGAYADPWPELVAAIRAA